MRDKEKKRASDKARQAAHPEKHRAWAAAYRARNLDKTRAQRKSYELQYHYGLTLEAFNAMLIGQDYKCAACGGPILSRPEQNVDHDHSREGAEAVRGILCSSCNKSAGILKDDPERCYALGKYLERAQR